MSFLTVIYDPELPTRLSQLRDLLTRTLTTSRSESATADAIGYYCRVTELRCLVGSLLLATPEDFDTAERGDVAEVFSVLDQKAGVFEAALSELEDLGVGYEVTAVLSSSYDEETPLQGIAAAAISVFLGCRLV